jgi:hypothetical protein
MSTVRHGVIRASLIGCLALIGTGDGARAFEFADTAAIGAAYMTHLSLHELGHQLVAEEAGTDAPRIHFFTKKNGRWYPGLSTYRDIPERSKLPYAVGGEWMAGFTFEYALESYHRKPTAYNKALLFFSGADFVVYTLLSNYLHPNNALYDPNLIRRETGISKEALLSLVAAKSLMNAYRVFHKDAVFIPMIAVNTTSAAFVVHVRF